MMRYSNQDAGATNNQSNRGLIVINNWKAKKRQENDCLQSLDIPFPYVFVTIYSKLENQVPKKLCYREINVLTRAKPNIATEI